MFLVAMWGEFCWPGQNLLWTRPKGDTLAVTALSCGTTRRHCRALRDTKCFWRFSETLYCVQATKCSSAANAALLKTIQHLINMLATTRLPLQCRDMFGRGLSDLSVPWDLMWCLYDLLVGLEVGKFSNSGAVLKTRVLAHNGQPPTMWKFSAHRKGQDEIRWQAFFGRAFTLIMSPLYTMGLRTGQCQTSHPILPLIVISVTPVYSPNKVTVCVAPFDSFACLKSNQ